MNEELKIIIKAAVDEAIKELQKTQKELKGVGKESEETAKDIEKMDEAFEEAKESAKTAMKGIGTAIAGAVTAAIGLVEATQELRTNQAKLKTAFTSTGSSAKTATKTYKDLYRVLGDDGQATEAAVHLAELTDNQEALADWTDICQGVYAKFGDSLPIEGLTEAVNHTTKLGEVQGPLADALEWSGIAADEFNAQLAECNTEAEREKLIRETLNGLYQTASKDYEQNAADVLAANDAQSRLNDSLAAAGEAFQPMVTELKNTGAAILEELHEPLKDVSEFLTETAFPAIGEVVDFIKENKEMVIGAITGIAGAYVTYKVAVDGSAAASKALEIASTALHKVMSLNPAALVAGAVVGLTVALIAYSDSLKNAKDDAAWLSEEEKALIENIDLTTESIKKSKEAYEEKAGTIEAERDRNKELADELLKLADANGKVDEANQIRAQFILNELNEALGTEYTMVDGVIQQYGTLEQKIYDVINAKTANSLLEAKNEAYVEAIENEDAALAELVAAQKDLEGQDNKLKETKEKNTARLEQLYKNREAALKSGSTNAMISIDAEIGKLEGAIAEEEDLYNKKKKTYDTAAMNYGSYQNTITDYENAAMAIQEGNYNDAIGMLKSKGGAFGDYSDEVDQATRDAVDALYKEAIDAGIAAARTKKNFEDGVDGYTEEMVKESEKAYEDALGAWSDAYTEAESIGKDVGDGLDNGLASKKSSLITRAKGLISSIWSAMKKEAESNSPSKKTMRLGEDLGAGAEIGLEHSTNDVVKSARNMITETLKPIQESVDGVSAQNFGALFTSFALGVNAPASKTTTSIENSSVNALVASMAGNNQPVVLQVDGKTLARVMCANINGITRQTGEIPLIIM